MASRIPELSAGDVQGVAAAVKTVSMRGVEPQDVDLAVARVLRDIPEEDRAWIVNEWMNDRENEVGAMLREAEARRGAAGLFPASGRRRVSVPYVLTSDEARCLEDAYPEFDLTYTSAVKHDHPLAAMSRRLDDMDCTGDIPPGLRYADFGGNLMYHVTSGHEQCLTVGGNIDEHDAAREVQRGLELRRLVRAPDTTPVTRKMAAAILAGDGRYRRVGTVQTFSEAIAVGKLVHVYDVPLRQLGAVMGRTGMAMFVGVVHFSSLMWELDEGFLPSIGARFTVDRANDELSMGFVDSSAKWYRHKWSEFAAYGTDQVFVEGGVCYSYKIVKRRGDTIRFRILPLPGVAASPALASFTSAYLDYVVVDGFRLTEFGRGGAKGSGAVTPDVKRYPRSTWERMVRYATVEVAKGTLDYNQLVGAYRSMTATLRYNGVDVAAARLPAAEVAQFIALVSAYALLEYARLRLSTQAFVADELWDRSLATRGALDLMAKSLLTAVKVAFGGPVWLLDAVVGWFMEKTSTKLLHGLVRAREAVRFVSVPVSAVMSTRGALSSGEASHHDYPFLSHIDRMREQWERDTELLRATVSAGREDAEPAKGSSVVSGESTLVQARVDGCPAWLPFDPVTYGPNAEVYTYREDAHGPETRMAAVVDAMQAAQEETMAVDGWMRGVFAQALDARGAPALSVLAQNRETWFDPVLWRVEGGKLVEDHTGAEAKDFEHMAVYCPERRVDTSGADGGWTGLYPVEAVVSEWTNSEGVFSRRYYQMPVAYTGWVMTCKKTLVYNGQEVRAALAKAAVLQHSYEGGEREGGPGCGKSYTIVRAVADRGDMVTSPLRKSVDDLRGDLQEVRGWSQASCARSVRTIDSLLVMFGRDGYEKAKVKMGSVDKLYVDECYITLPGKLYAVAALLGARTVVVFGDTSQIPSGVRATYLPTYVLPRFRHHVMTYIVHRSCPRVLATYNAHYNWKLRTTVKGDGEVAEVASLAGRQLSGNVAHLFMYQAARKSVTSVARGMPKKFLGTAHEAQGITVDTVVLHDLDPKVRASDFDLYNNPNYVNVAFSRARFGLLLHKPGGADNLARRWLANASNATLVALCTDLATVGQAR